MKSYVASHLYLLRGMLSFYKKVELKNVLITGAAGFIGYHLSDLLCKQGHRIIGVDSLNGYYELSLKLDRLKLLEKYDNFSFYKIDISHKDKLNEVYTANDVDVVINLAAQAGVRYSMENPMQYIESNVVGFMNILEACRNYGVEHLIFASSSSVYGANASKPFNTNDHTDHPISLYAATKKANESMAHSYAALYDIPVTGLRFFTVYGPWGRPDMSYYLFTDKIINNKPIQLFNEGNMRRDFTYVDDIVQAISLLVEKPPRAKPEKKGTQLNISESFAPYKLYNIGNNNPEELKHFVSVIEKEVGKKAIIENKPMQMGDMLETYADVDDLIADVGYKPKVPIEEGLKQFVQWYKTYYNK